MAAKHIIGANSLGMEREEKMRWFLFNTSDKKILVIAGNSLVYYLPLSTYISQLLASFDLSC